MNAYYNNDNFNYTPDNNNNLYQPAPVQTPKKKNGSGKIVAMALCFSLLGGALGTGGTYLALHNSNNSSSAVSTQSSSQTEKEPAILNSTEKTEKSENTDTTESKIENYKQAADTKTKMTAAEVYKSNVNSTVGITTSINTNYLGYKTSSAASGSGFIISKDGYIVTNHHVIEDANKITVTLYDGKAYEAELVGSDANSDVAVLKIDADNLTPVTIGSSTELVVGDEVAAIGNPLGELTFSLTKGVVSALDRTVTIENKVMTLIQTDTAINSGNSGGALFNMYGEVVGITNARCATTGSGYSVDNIGFAIPIDSVKSLINSLVDNGYAAKPYIGIGSIDASKDDTQDEVTEGALIKKVYEDSPAEKAGVQVGDIVAEINGKKVKTAGELTNYIKSTSSGDELTLKIYRDGSYKEIKVTVIEKKVDDSEDEKTDDKQSYQQYGDRQGRGNSTNPFDEYGDFDEFPLY